MTHKHSTLQHPDAQLTVLAGVINEQIALSFFSYRKTAEIIFYRHSGGCLESTPPTPS
jgi:hypothetical protein